MKETKPIHERLKEERVRQGMTQTELAKKHGTSRENISRIERGINSQTIKDFEAYVVSLTGKPPKISIFSKTQNPFKQSYAYFEITSVVPLTKEHIQIEGYNRSDAKLELNKTAKDINARIDFWEIVVDSGALAEPCNGLEIHLKTDKKQVDNRTFRAFVDSVSSGLFVTETTTDERFNVETEWSRTSLVRSVHIDTQSGIVEIIFGDNYSNVIESYIKKIIANEKNRLNEAKEFINENPNGFSFVCYKWPLDLNEYNEDPLRIKIIEAWSADDAKQQYLMLDKNQRLYNFYYYDLENKFAESVLYDDYLYDKNPLKNSEEIRIVAEKTIEGLISETESYAIGSVEEKRILESVKKRNTKDELLELLGMDGLETFWLEYSKADISAHMLEDQAQIAEYVYSALAFEAE